MSRFAILTHDHPFLHWDFLLENGESCRTWRFLSPPDTKTPDFEAEELPDHRLMYLDYEGPVRQQRGNVVRWDAGTFLWQINQNDVCEVELHGQRWWGSVRLVRKEGPRWSGSLCR